MVNTSSIQVTNLEETLGYNQSTSSTSHMHTVHPRSSFSDSAINMLDPATVRPNCKTFGLLTFILSTQQSRLALSQVPLRQIPYSQSQKCELIITFVISGNSLY